MSDTQRGARRGPPPIETHTSTREFRVHGVETRFYGRKDELEALYNAARDTVNDRRLRVINIVGSGGIGKTRLAVELITLLDVGRRGIGVLFTDSVAGETAQSLRFTDQVIRQRFAIDTSEAEPVRAQIERGLHGIVDGKRALEAVRLLMHLLSVPTPAGSRPAAEVASDTLHRRAVRTFYNLLRFDASQRPLILVADNFHAAPPATREVLTSLLQTVGDCPALALILSRKPVAPADLGGIEPARIELGPLSDEIMRCVLGHLLQRVEGFPDGLVQETIERAAGSPALLEDLVRLMYQRGVLEVDGDHVAVRLERLKSSSLPGTTAGATQARIDNLAERERQVLEMASVFGRVFWFGGVLSMLRLDRRSEDDEKLIYWLEDKREARLNATLLEMQGDDLIEFRNNAGIPGEVAFAFANPDEQQRLYSGLERGRRELYHRMAAQWLRRVAPEGVYQVQEVIAWHFQRGGRSDAAARTWVEAARLARSAYQNPTAIDLYQRALSLYDAGDASSQCGVYCELADTLLSVGETRAAFAAGRELLYCSTVAGDKRWGAAAFLRLGRVASGQGEYEEAIGRLDRAMQLYTAVGDVGGIADCQEEVGHLHRVRGEYGSYKSALGCFQKSLALRRQLGDERAAARSLVQMGHIYLGGGQLRRAAECYDEALGLHRRLSDPWGLARTLNGVGAVHYEAGRLQPAQEAWAEGLDVATGVGDRELAAMIQNNLAEAHLGLDQLSEAADLLGQAWDTAIEIGDRRLQAEVLRSQADLARMRGQYETALDRIDKALALGREINARQSVGTALRTQGAVLAEILRRGPGTNTGGYAMDGAEERVTAAFQQSMAWFEEMGDRLGNARTMRAYGAFLLDLGSQEKARKLLQRAEQVLSDATA